MLQRLATLDYDTLPDAQQFRREQKKRPNAETPEASKTRPKTPKRKIFQCFDSLIFASASRAKFSSRTLTRGSPTNPN